MPKIRSGTIGSRSRALVAANPKTRSLVPRSGRQNLPQITLPEVRRATRSVYVSDHPDVRSGTRLRWLISTCLAAGIAVSAFALILYGSLDPGTDLWAAMNKTITITISAPSPSREPATGGGKTDRLLVSARGLTTRHVIHDTVQQQKDARTFISIKPYVRVVARLSSALDPDSQAVPPFNPVTLFAATNADDGRDGTVKIKVAVLDLPGGFLPAEDNQDLTDADVAAIVRDQVEAGTGAGNDATGGLADESEPVAENDPSIVPPDTADIPKNKLDPSEFGSADGDQIRVVAIGDKVGLSEMLTNNGVPNWQAREIAQAARSGLGAETLEVGQQARLTFAPEVAGQESTLLAVSIYGEDQTHVLTVARNSAGSYAASTTPILPSFKDVDQPQVASLYSSFYRAALAQGISPPMIMTMLRTFAYDTDFKRRVSPGDGFEAFFDLDEESTIDASNPSATGGTPRNLLYMALTVGGETRRFYRFRLPEGGVDYFDRQGNNAKRFLLRKPVRGNEVRFTSGFGVRVHPILKIRKMHTGADWATAAGTPIVAAGNGVIEEMGRKGGNGNYVRIKHANGYETAYSHMSRFQPGLGVGAKVTQGQVIGYVGSTGFSSGPHLHFEVLINRNFVDPMTIHVPRERQLTKKALTDFQREQSRIDELMARAPVSTVVAQTTSG